MDDVREFASRVRADGGRAGSVLAATQSETKGGRRQAHPFFFRGRRMVHRPSTNRLERPLAPVRAKNTPEGAARPSSAAPFQCARKLSAEPARSVTSMRTRLPAES